MRLIALALLAGLDHEHVIPVDEETSTNNDMSVSNSTIMTGREVPIDDPAWLVAVIDAGIVVLYLITVGIVYFASCLRRPWLPTQSAIASQKPWMDIAGTRQRPPTSWRPSPAVSRRSSPAVSRRASPESRRASPIESRRTSPASRRDMRVAARS